MLGNQAQGLVSTDCVSIHTLNPKSHASSCLCAQCLRHMENKSDCSFHLLWHGRWVPAVCMQLCSGHRVWSGCPHVHGKHFPRETHGGHLLFSPTLINSGLRYFHTHTPVYPNLEKHSSSNFGKCGVPKPPQVFHTSDRGQDE